MGRLKRVPDALRPPPRAVGFADRAAYEKARDRARVLADNLRGLYRTARWKRTRLEVLDRDLWTCRQSGVMLIGKYPAPNSPVVDHIAKPEGSLFLFWDLDNLQAVSKVWHDNDKQVQEQATARRLRTRGGGVNL